MTDSPRSFAHAALYSAIGACTPDTAETAVEAILAVPQRDLDLQRMWIARLLESNQDLRRQLSLVADILSMPECDARHDAVAELTRAYRG